MNNSAPMEGDQVSQPPNNLSEPLMSPVKEAQPRQSESSSPLTKSTSSTQSVNNTRTDVYFKDYLTKRLRELKLFPLFGDKELSKISVNYWLYLEFFHSAIILFGKLFAFALTVYILETYVLERFKVSQKGSDYYVGYVIAMGLLLVFFRFRGESNLIQDDLVFKFQWTEDLFCLLIENVPKSCSRDELVRYFNSLLPLRITGGYVRNIMIVKDYYDFAFYKKKIEEIDKKLEDPELEDAAKKKLEEQRAQWIPKISVEEWKLGNFQGHNGKAIVTFNNIFTRNLVYNQLRPSFVRSITKFFSNFMTSNLNSKRILIARELPEPQDLVYENICYSDTKKVFRTVFAYGGGIAVVSFLMYVIGYFQIEGKRGGGGMHPYVISIILILVNQIMAALYKYLNSFYIHLSASQIKMNLLNYSIYISITLYLVFQTIFILYSDNTWDAQLSKTIAIYAIKTAGTKFAFMLLNTEKFNELLAKWKKDKVGEFSVKIISKAQDKSTEFDFAQNIIKVIPILFMCFGFMMLNPLLILPIAMVSLYIIALLDKHRMIHHCEPFTLNSAGYMLKAWKIFQWDHFCVFYGAMTLITIKSTGGTTNPDLVATYAKMGQALIGFYLIALLFFGSPSSLKNKFKDQFIKDNSAVFYDSICQQFTSLYHKSELSNHFGKYREPIANNQQILNQP